MTEVSVNTNFYHFFHIREYIYLRHWYILLFGACTMSLSMLIEYLWNTACMFYNRVLSIEYCMVAKSTVLSWSWRCFTALVCWYLMQIKLQKYCSLWLLDLSYSFKIYCGDFKFNRLNFSRVVWEMTRTISSAINNPRRQKCGVYALLG